MKHSSTEARELDIVREQLTTLRRGHQRLKNTVRVMFWGPFLLAVSYLVYHFGSGDPILTKSVRAASVTASQVTLRSPGATAPDYSEEGGWIGGGSAALNKRNGDNLVLLSDVATMFSTSNFVVLDDKGRERLVLELHEDGTRMALLEPDGAVLWSLGERAAVREEASRNEEDVASTSSPSVKN